MPGTDRTGPLGQGPLTGRGAGLCGQGEWPGLAAVGSRGVGSRGQGRFGRGRRGGRRGGGGGYGYRHQFWATGQTLWQRAAAAAEQAPLSAEQVEAVDQPQEEPPALAEDVVVALREQVAGLARSLQALQLRLDQLEEPRQ